MKANEDRQMLTAEELEQLRGGFSNELVISESEEISGGHGGFLSNCDCGKEKTDERDDRQKIYSF